MPTPTEPADPTADFAVSLLQRAPSVVNGPAAEALLRGKRVLVTGAAGSIGSELARQAHRLGADVFYLDLDESRLHALRLAITGSGLIDDPTVVLADIRDATRVRQAFCEVRPDVVYHAAAHKHLPLLERHPSEGVKTNVLGTDNLVRAAKLADVDRFILVSTDKAADPTSVLGATKRLAELIVAMNAGSSMKVASVRFGNVLGSRGSLLDTIRHQVRSGITISITDPDVDRFFMTIPEAVGLVIEASVMANDGETYVLDMGEPVRIVDLVERYARYVGVPMPNVEYIGLRPGEKLTEALFSDDEHRLPTANDRIWQTPQQQPDLGFQRLLRNLYTAAADCDDDAVRNLLEQVMARLSIAA